MNSQFSSGNPKIFAVIGLIFAIFSFLFSIVPCIGFYAIGPSIMSIVFCGISFLGLKQKNQNTGVSTAGLIVGVIAISIGIFQYYKYKTVFDAKAEIENSLNNMEDQVLDTIEKKALKQVKEKIEKEIENDSIEKIKSDSINQ